MALATELGQSGSQRGSAGGRNGLPPLRVAIDRARQIAAAAQGLDDLASSVDGQEEHAALQRAKAHALRAERFFTESALRAERFSTESTSRKVLDAAQLALEHRKAIKAGHLSVFIPAFVFALAKDGFLDMVPGIGQILGPPVAIYLFIFLWGHGVWKLRIMTRIIVGILSMLDIIPVIGMIPMSTLAVFYVYRQVSKKAFEAKMELKELEKSM